MLIFKCPNLAFERDIYIYKWPFYVYLGTYKTELQTTVSIHDVIFEKTVLFSQLKFAQFAVGNPPGFGFRISYG